MRIQFGLYRLDDRRFILERKSERVGVRPKVFDLLAYLVRERDRVVPREELVGALWGGASVGMGSLSGLVNELRKLLQEGGRGASSIRTVHARGYQFVAQVEILDEDEAVERRDEFSGAAHSAASRGGVPEMLPAPILRALWLHLRDDAERIDLLAAWLEQLRSETLRSGRNRMKWKVELQAPMEPIRRMRTVDVPPTPRAAEPAPSRRGSGGESGRSA